jgi:hypothetical protein
VQVGDPPGDGQPEAGAATAVDAEGAEALERPLSVAGCDSGSLVGHLEQPAVAGQVGADGDRAAGRTVPRCVVEHVGDELVEPSRVALDGEIGRVDANVVRHVAAGDAGLADRVVEQPAHVHPLACERCLARVDPGEVEQVPDQTSHPLALVERGAERHRVGLGNAVGEVLEEGVEGGQRRAQLVADVGDELASLAVDGGQLVGHPVERVGQLADLVPGRRGDADVVMT